MTPANLADLRSDVDDLVGADLAGPVRDRYINEGHVELCTRAQWSKATLEIGPGVAGQSAYDFPATMRLPLRLWVNGSVYDNTDQAGAREIERGLLTVMGDGAWWIEHTDDGSRKIGVNPVSDGSGIKVLAVVTPAELEDDEDEPLCPPDFRQAIVDYVAGYALGRIEDLTEDREYHQQKFDAEVDRLWRLGNELEGGAGPGQVLLKGVHW